MDPAQMVEAYALRHQIPMNAVIDAGDSPVQQYYSGATVFLTGGSGFLGKHLIEKLFRSCAIKKMYLLSRPKKGQTIQERVKIILEDPVYDKLRTKQPNFADLIVPVQGDVSEIRLGLDDKDFQMLAEEVNIIFHVAAIVRFHERLHIATLTNVRGTREVLSLAKQCTNLKQLVHVSTAFVHTTRSRINKEVLEEFYPSPVPPEAMIAFAEQVDAARLDDITPNLIKDWPNTYTFTKALAEELIRTTAGDVPVCIVRPSIVLPAYYEPSPGWLDNGSLAGPSGLYLGGILGILHVIYSNANNHLAVTPVDFTNNAIISAAWDSTEKQLEGGTGIPIYTIRTNMKLGLISEIATNNKNKILSPAAVSYISFWHFKNIYLYRFFSLLVHYIPAYALDIVCKILRKKPKGISSFVRLYQKADNLSKIYDYFKFNEWDLKVDNLNAIMLRMNDADRSIFNCDVDNIDVEEYNQVWFIGLRKYILKDGLKNTHIGIRNQQIFRVIFYMLCLSIGYLLWCVYTLIFKFVQI